MPTRQAVTSETRRGKDHNDIEFFLTSFAELYDKVQQEGVQHNALIVTQPPLRLPAS